MSIQNINTVEEIRNIYNVAENMNIAMVMEPTRAVWTPNQNNWRNDSVSATIVATCEHPVYAGQNYTIVAFINPRGEHVYFSIGGLITNRTMCVYDNSGYHGSPLREANNQ